MSRIERFCCATVSLNIPLIKILSLNFPIEALRDNTAFPFSFSIVPSSPLIAIGVKLLARFIIMVASFIDAFLNGTKSLIGGTSILSVGFC